MTHSFSPQSHLFFTLLALLSTSSFALYDGKCRALVLQGGGDKGAYEAGVLSGFLHNTATPEDFQYNVVTGVSVGSINGMNFAQFKVGEETKAADFLVQVWHNTTRDDVFTEWPLGIAQGLLLEPALYNSTPEDGYLRSHVLNLPNNRNITVVSTDANTGKKVAFNNSFWQENVSLALDATMYSSAVPILFLYKNFENYTLIDGGWSGEGLDIEDAVNSCREIVDDDSKIIVDIIFANNISFTDVKAEGYNTLQVLNRYSSIWSYVAAVRTYEYALKDYPQVDFRYVMVASERLPDQDVPLDFSQANIDFMINLGVKDAVNALKKGPKDGRDRFMEDGRRFRL